MTFLGAYIDNRLTGACYYLGASGPATLSLHEIEEVWLNRQASWLIETAIDEIP